MPASLPRDPLMQATGAVSLVDRAGDCFHCGQQVPEGSAFATAIEGVTRPMCCAGCQAVAEAIVSAGHAAFYRKRTEVSALPPETLTAQLDAARRYDHPAVHKRFVHAVAAGHAEVSLLIEGVSCAACLWLNERHLRALPGVIEAEVNYTTHRVHVAFDEERTTLGAIVAGIARIGYVAHPWEPSRAQEAIERERKGLLNRLLIAGLLGGQVMMIAMALYAGAWHGIETEYRRLFEWASLGLTIPVIAYSAQPFLRGAWRDARNRVAGMDVPVSLGIGVAFIGSAWATWHGTGEVWYDSVTMFVFLLLAARFAELAARRRAMLATAALAPAPPALVSRLGVGGEERVAVAEIEPGQRILVRPGETVAVDGLIVEGRSTLDESLLTGESMPVARAIGEEVIAGTINVESPLTVEVRRVGAQTVLAAIERLVERARAGKPAIALLADRIAARFVFVVLALAAGVAWWGIARGADGWLAATIAVLVASCPCALSLATPAALAAANTTLARSGLLPTRVHALETLARITHVVFDKTGTLTEGRPVLRRTLMLDVAADRTDAQRGACALARRSEHPLSRALCAAIGPVDGPGVKDVLSVPGQGLTGRLGDDDDTVALGSLAFVTQRLGISGEAPPRVLLAQETGSVVVYGKGRRLVAAFVFEDRLREGAKALVARLVALGIVPVLWSGDREIAVEQVARATGIARHAGGLSPADKAEHVARLQEEGAVVAMIGDGVNDAPALARAQVSIAMGSGTHLAAASADLVLPGARLDAVAEGVRVARRAFGIIRENFVWALGYNALVLPLAAAGALPPWAAALGMSASSLIVVLNARRLLAPSRERAGRG